MCNLDGEIDYFVVLMRKMVILKVLMGTPRAANESNSIELISV
jgi:hypothetical protein